MIKTVALRFRQGKVMPVGCRYRQKTFMIFNPQIYNLHILQKEIIRLINADTDKSALFAVLYQI